MSTAAVTFDAFNLAAVAAQLRAVGVGARVQKIQQPSANELIIALYGRSGAQRLLISVDPQAFRVHLTQQRRENPVNAPGFCAVCRKYLDGAILAEVVMPRFDRVLHVVFRTAEGERATLIAELMGRNANLILTSGSGTVRAVMRPQHAESSRPLRIGQPYSDPPGYTDRVDPLTIVDSADPIFRDMPANSGPDEIRAWLSVAFSGIGRFGAGEIMARLREGNAGEALFAVMEDVRAFRFAPYSIAGGDGATVGVWALVPLTIPADRRFPRDDISVALDTFYATQISRIAETTEKDQLVRTLAKEIAYRDRETVSAKATLDEVGRAELYERMGNNLIAQLNLVTRGASEVIIPDLYADDSPDATITITLDPKRSPHENAEGLFQRARKARDAAEYAEGRLVDLQADLARLRALSGRLVAVGETETDFALIRRDLSEIVGAARGAAALPKPAAKARPKEKPFGGHRIRTFTVEGFELLIGETAEANDYLTTRVASPSDIWMHVRSAPGAHGVLRAQGKPARVPDAVVRRAAEIVAARSGTAVKHASVVAVDVVEKRHVRKPRGAKPGQVTYVFERVLDVVPIL